MQKIATKVFTYASIAFGLFGVLMIITAPSVGATGSTMNHYFEKLVMISVFVILPSFALSVAGKYLNSKS